MGVAYGQIGRFDEAIEAFRSALASGPASAHVLSNLGFAQLKVGRLQEASESLQRSLQLDPVNRRTRENMALLDQAQQQVAQAAVARQATADDLSMKAVQPAPSAPVPVAPVAAAPAAPEPVASTPADAAPAIEAPTLATSAVEAPATVQPVHMAAVQIVSSSQAPGSIDWAARIVTAAKSIAATVLSEASSTPSYEIVISRSADAALVQVAPNVYELESAAKTATLARMEPVQVLAVPKPVQRAGATVVAAKAAPARMSLSAIDGLEVSNGAGVNRLASRTAHQLARFGADVARVTNYRSFDRKVTEVQYRDGHLDGAKAVQQRLPVGAKLVRTGDMNPGVNVRLVLGRDMVVTQVASWFGETPAVETTAAAPVPVQAATSAPVRMAAPTDDVGLQARADTIVRADRKDGWRYM
ncbi:MAG: LytR C-terminal domain-containing protein [Burkholderiaceae bacterium]|nr:LytR C-terminal domain-containing protein [Burkholderiaceae bacterium]